MELSKIQISKLNGNNWIQWKFRMSALLRGIDGLLDFVQGNTEKPKRPVAEGGIASATSTAVLTEYNKQLSEYVRLESTALLQVTNNISDEILDKVIRFSSPKEIWDELHRFYDGVNEDKLYELSWMLMSKKDRTIDNITSQLCAHERAMTGSKEGMSSEALLTKTSKKFVEQMKEQTPGNKKVTKFRCHVCKMVGHFRKDCPKNKQDRGNGSRSSKMMVLLTNNELSVELTFQLTEYLANPLEDPELCVVHAINSVSLVGEESLAQLVAYN
ncbi:unnamed protein product [Leptidea sinapis]|uniref:CCHC-type domain-containing protein n=1 Tax=Leptidea sinapis TaxID=189913 RepID=A0A5E4QMW3_9NEOP|nr:unnamed protein product [Leptidea sinapis]